MGKLREEIVKSVCRSHPQTNFKLSVYTLMDNEFELHVDEANGYFLDPDSEPLNCHMIEYETGVIVKLTANTFFGCTLEVVEDPKNILGEGWVVGEPEHLYDSLSPLNPCRRKDAN